MLQTEGDVSAIPLDHTLPRQDNDVSAVSAGGLSFFLKESISIAASSTPIDDDAERAPYFTRKMKHKSTKAMV